MKKFQYTIKDRLGIHARPAGMLAKVAKELDSEITVTKGEKTAIASKLIALMGLGVKHGDSITISITGGNEENSEKVLKEFFEKNL